jgi:hypothetical protein
MKIQIFSENEWLYPDSELKKPADYISLDAARGSDVCFQVLTDQSISKKTEIKYKWNGINTSPSCKLYQLLPAVVDENSAGTVLTTLDYDSVSHFVTRKAPFSVFDVTRDIDDGCLKPGRVAFYVRIQIPRDTEPGEYEYTLNLNFSDNEACIKVFLKVYKSVVPDLKNAVFGMNNWLNLPSLAKTHGLTNGSDEYREMISRYIDNQLDMRNTHLMLPSGVPVRDKEGKIIDFDFSEAIMTGNMAIEKGFRYILGGFVARFKNWDDKEHFLLWDRDVSCTSFEAYRQLKIYFGKLWNIINENNWTKVYNQCLVDEPQFPNSEHYRILSGICRKFLPGIPINDPVESTDLEGSLEVWVVKQAIYEKYIEKYRKLQALWEEMWIYTCGFPGGYVMNRVMDLPLLVCRLPMWMCAKYDAKGFLHWGYNVFNEDVFGKTCYRVDKSVAYPAGNAHVVYPGEGKPWDSVRSHLQRAGAEDFE